MFSSSFRYILLAAACALALASCSDEIDVPDYVKAGEDMTVVVPLKFSEPTVQSRADLSETQLNTVRSLWVATFSSATGQMTSKKNADSDVIGWMELTPGTSDIEPVLHEVTIRTKSGPSYIVAVANVENNGVLKSNPEDVKPLSELLAGVTTWSEFLNVGVVAPSTYAAINAPTPPLVMCGAFTNTIKVVSDSHITVPLAQWQNENIKPYTIPSSTNGTFALNGAIHLRRVVSQINFNIKSGNANVNITPNSYRIVNVPRYSWLYERPADAAAATTANFGDDCTDDNKGSFYVASESYSSAASFIRKNDDGSFGFNFWQAENKHTGTITATGTPEEIYKARDAQTKADDGANSGIFTALCPSGTWTPNNMAGYVLINCTVDYKESINVDENGEVLNPPTGTAVWRTGTATYLVHLGYMGGDATDFNSYRNADYTYNVTVNGLNDIRVEAFNTAETPGAEGTVTDAINPTINLDCHYGAFNIELTDSELAAWTQTPGGNYTGFGFMIMTYDNINGGLKEYDEVKLLTEYATWNDVPDDIKKYVGWVELRPTTGRDVLAAYKPRTGDNADGATFNLYDAAKGILSDTRKKSDSGWYTCFVNEYTYEADGADESMKASDTYPIWYSYVNADPRRFYIRVTRHVSDDGESVYARSKYAAVQNSIQTYYGRQAIPEGAGHVRGAAMGIESLNEIYGLNIRRSWTTGDNVDNGRYNCWLWADGKSWSTCVDQTKPQTIPASTNVTGVPITAATYNVPKTADYTGTFTGAELVTRYDPQGYITSTTSTANRERAIEAINACMNRNRDNNGNSTIDNDEIRWYVPSMNQYTRLTLGANSLGTNALMNYAKVDSCGHTINGTFSFGFDGRYLFYASNGRVFWAMEGFSASGWREWGTNIADAPGDPVAPWQVRCIRNLGTNLATVNSTSQSVKAYTVTTSGKYKRVVPTYYELTNTRSTYFSGNGDINDGKMPVNLMSDIKLNAVYSGGFEILSDDHDFSYTSGTIGGYVTYIEGDPCGNLRDDNNNLIDGGRWRVPNATELAIMQNEGEFTSQSQPYVCCTMLDFNGSGKEVKDAANGSFLLSAYQHRITREFAGTFYFRCVRDIIE